MASLHAVETADVRELSLFIDTAPALGDFKADTLAGLSATPKTSMPKYFYDEAGSAFFDDICEAPEYYPTRTEISILQARAKDIAVLAGPEAAIIELGSGSSIKIRLLLDALDAPALYVAQDISREHLLNAAQAVAADYPHVPVGAVCGDFTKPMTLPEDALRSARRRVVFFPGSTLGNFAPEDARAILRSARGLLRTDDLLVLGADLKKDPDTLVRAYDDAGGATAAFNLNLLTRINRELQGDLKLDAFRHRSVYNDTHARVEMHLESLADQTFTVAGQTFSMAQGETIHTENSHKFDHDRLSALGAQADFALEHLWTDDAALFSVSVFRAR